MTSSIEDAVAQIRCWGEARDWRGYDPYDALSSPFAPYVTLGTILGRRVLTQTVKLSPVNFRPVLRIAPEWNPKAIGLIASGYARLAAVDGDPSLHSNMCRWLDWLVENNVGDSAGPAWGYPFPVQTRICFYDARTPNTIATSFVAHAFLDAWELLGDERWGDVAQATARRLGVRMLTDGRHGRYFRYLEKEPELVHNANLLASSAVARVARVFRDTSMLEAAAAAVETTLAAQRDDGSWPYGDAEYLSWVDNFHTAYVLECLAECAKQMPAVNSSLVRGVEFWERNLFLPDGTPKYYADRIGPLDAHNVASAIDTWLSLLGIYPDALANAQRLGDLLIQRLLDPAGFVRFQRTRLWTNRVPFVRWTTAPAFRALAGILLAERRTDRRANTAGRVDARFKLISRPATP